MRRMMVVSAFACGLMAGCMAAGPPAPAEPPPIASAAGTKLGTPLVIDRADFRLGTTVHFPRIPSATELYELQQINGLAHVVLTLPGWPTSYADLTALQQLPPESDLIVVLPGFPPSREAANAWNLLEIRVRLILVVDAGAPSPSAIADLNALRSLERVIVETDYPTRSGFERLQRPVSFRVVRH